MKRFLILCGLAACAAAGAANWELLSAGSRGDARVIPSPDGFSIELVNADGVNNYATVMCNPEAVPAEGKQMNFTLQGAEGNGKAVLTPFVLIERGGKWMTHEGRTLPLLSGEEKPFQLDFKEFQGNNAPGTLRQLKFVLRSTGEPKGKKSMVTIRNFNISEAATEKPAPAPAKPGELRFRLLPVAGVGEGKVTDNGSGGCTISLTNTAKNNYVIALAGLDRRAAAQQKLAFRVRGKAANGGAHLTACLVVDRNGRWDNINAPGIEVRNDEFKSVVLGLDTDFSLGDALWNLKQLKFVLNGSGNPAGSTAEVEIENVRIVSADELSGAGADFLVVPFPKKPESRAVPGVTPVKVWFDFDNDDLSGRVQSRVSPGVIDDEVPTAGFRSRLLAGAEGIVELASSPEEADVLVYSRAAAGNPEPLLRALENGKRLIVYGRPADPELAGKLPLALEPLPLAGFAPRSKVKPAAEHPLFAGQAPAGGDFGRYFKSALQSGKTLLAFEDGSPFLAEDGNVLQFAAGIGGALLSGELFYDKLFLRAAALGNAPALAALAAREDEVTSRRRAEETKYVESVLAAAGIDPGSRHYRPGMSRDNMGRFGWLIGEGLSCDSIGRDLTVANGAQSYRFDADGKLSVPFANWSRKAVKGNIQFPPSSGEIDPCEEWTGVGEVEYTADLVMDPAWKGKILKFEVKAGIDDIDSASLNGVPIGETGEKVPYHWMTPRAYAIPQNAVRWGEPNRFTVRVGNLRGGARFGSRPYLTVAENAGTPEIAVSAVDWVGKTCRISSNGQARELQMTLLAPFIRYTFPQTEVMLAQENTADYAAWSTPVGIRIADLRRTPDLFELKRDGRWNAPWLLLFREKAGNPLLLVFAEQPGSLQAQVRGSVLEGIRIGGEENRPVGIVAAGWPWGITAPETAGWSKELPDAALRQIAQGVNMALNLPVGCDEVFSLDTRNNRVEIVNRFRFRPVEDAWHTPLEPFATLPPLAAFALRQGKLVETDEVTDFKLNTRLGPTVGRRNSATIRYSLPLPPPEDLTITGIRDSGPLGREWNDIFRSGVRYSCGGGVPVTAWTPAKPAGGLPTGNIDLFAWNFGMTTALQGGLLLNDENRQKLEERCRRRFIEPIELYQYKNFARHRKEPFSGLEYPISFNSFYPNNTAYAPGMGSKVIYGDANEACSVAVWVGQQLADVYGHAGLVRGNWNFFKEVMRQNLFIDDYAFHAGSCREFGVGAWIDMLNGEYAGMLYFARLAALAGDTETEAHALYRAAKRMLPTLMRLNFKAYMAEAMPEVDTAAIGLVTGFGEDGVKTMRFPTENFVTAMDLFDFSQGSPGVLYRLYRSRALPEIRTYLRETALPLLTDEKNFLMRSAYLQPFAMYGEDLAALEKSAAKVAELRGPGLRQDWPGICAPFHFGCTLWRKYAAPAFSECRELDIARAEYDPAAKRLAVELKAVPQSRLVVESAAPPKRILRNGTPVEAGKAASGFALPLLEGENEFIVEF